MWKEKCGREMWKCGHVEMWGNVEEMWKEMWTRTIFVPFWACKIESR